MKKLVIESLNENIEDRSEVSDSAYPYWFAINEVREYCESEIYQAKQVLKEGDSETGSITAEAYLQMATSILEILKNI